MAVTSFNLRLNWKTPDTSSLTFDVTLDAPLSGSSYRLVIPGVDPVFERDFPTIRKLADGTLVSSDGIVTMTVSSSKASFVIKGGGGFSPYAVTSLANHLCPKISDASVQNLGIERVVSVKDSPHEIRLILETAEWEPSSPGVPANHRRGTVVFDSTVSFKWENIKGVLGRSTAWSEKKA